MLLNDSTSELAWYLASGVVFRESTGTDVSACDDQDAESRLVEIPDPTRLHACPDIPARGGVGQEDPGMLLVKLFGNKDRFQVRLTRI